MSERAKGGARPLAVVTGASSGIGEAFARRLAREGYDLMLVARRKDRLDALAAELRAVHGAGVEIAVADLANDEQIAVLAERLCWTPVDLLVNNAGFMLPKTFAEAEAGPWDTMVRLQCLATVRLTHAVIGGMLKRNHGGVINVASTASFVPIPRNAVYSAVKRFLVVFSEGLSQELHGTGVRVQALCPGWTQTELVDKPEVDTSHISKGWWSKPEDVVDASLAGLRRGKLIVIPGWRNRLMIFAVAITYRPLLRWMVRRFKKNQVEMKKP